MKFKVARFLTSGEFCDHQTTTCLRPVERHLAQTLPKACMGPLLWAAVDSNGDTSFIWLVYGRHLGQRMGWPEGYLNRDLIFVRNPS